MISTSRHSPPNPSAQSETCACSVSDPLSASAARGRLIPPATARDLARRFAALGDPTRVRILSALLDAEVCVGDLAAALGMAQSAVSHQLSTMRELNLVAARRAGKHVFYRLDDDHVRELFAQGLKHVTHG